MCLKKNAVSYVCWALMLLFAGSMMLFWGQVASEMVANGNLIAAIGFLILFFVIAFSLYCLTGMLLKYCKTLNTDYLNDKTSVVEELIIVCLVIVTFVTVRVYLMPILTIDTTYYDLTRIADSGNVSIRFVQGSSYYYSMFLHGCFQLFGNHLMLGIWLQIILQAISALLIYMAVRRMAGKIVAIFMLVVVCMSSTAVEEGLTYSPQMLYLCIFGMAFWLCAEYLHYIEKKDSSAFLWVFTVLVGAVIGFVCYVDITGILLMMLPVCMCMVNKKAGSATQWYLRFLTIVGAALAMFFIMIFLDSLISGTTFVRVLNAWLMVYSDVRLHVEALTKERRNEFLLLPILILMGLFSFFRRKNTQRFAPFILMVVGMTLLYFCGVTGENMDGGYLLLILMTVLAGISVEELFYRGETEELTEEQSFADESFEPEELVAARPQIEEEPRMAEAQMEVSEAEASELEETMRAEPGTEEPVIVLEETPVEVNQTEKKLEETDLEKKENTKNEVEMIENPLPVPKKKERKVMDYAFQPSMSQMMYDIRVSEKDDFDI